MNKSPALLIVEDEKNLSDAISKKLELNGFHTDKANSVEEAVKLLDSNHYEAVWLDHYLAGHKTGLDLVQIIKKDPKLKTLPIFLVSNTASDAKVRSYMEMGVEKYYVKSDNRLDSIVNAIKTRLNV